MKDLLARLCEKLHNRQEAKALRQCRANAPKTIEEAVQRLKENAAPFQLIQFANRSREDCITGFGPFHGVGLRNGGGLHGEEITLSRQLTAAGILHHDDKSAVIFTALWCDLHNLPLDLAAEARRYRVYWKRQGCNPDGSPIPGLKAD